MQKKQAVFIIGSPGSGKDVVIRDIASNFNIVEFQSTQIDAMLSDDATFKQAKYEKRNSLLERNSLLVTANSFDLGFILTKSILEAVGYTTHLIFVEADLSVACDRLHGRTNIKESLDRISIGNSNKDAILKLFESSVLIDNSKTLDLTESREFVSDILEELSFKSDMTLESAVNLGSIKAKISKVSDTIKPHPGGVEGRSSICLPILDSYKEKPTKKKIPRKFNTDFDIGGSAPVSGMAEWLEYPMTMGGGGGEAGLGTTAGPTGGTPSIDSRSDDDKIRFKKVLNKLKNVKFKEVVPNGIE